MSSPFVVEKPVKSTCSTTFYWLSPPFVVSECPWWPKLSTCRQELPLATAADAEELEDWKRTETR